MAQKDAEFAALVAAVGRNDPCPCGSGLKTKRCHGVNEEPVAADFSGVPLGTPRPRVGATGSGSRLDPGRGARRRGTRT